MNTWRASDRRLCVCLCISRPESPFSALFDPCCSVVPWTSGRQVNSYLKPNYCSWDTRCRTIRPQRNLTIPSDPAVLSHRLQSSAQAKQASYPLFRISEKQHVFYDVLWSRRCFVSDATFFGCFDSVHIMKVSSLCEWQDRRRKGEEGGGSGVKPFTLQERSQRGAEGIQSQAQPVWEDTTLNMLISPLISTWKYLVSGKEFEKPEIMSDYNSARPCCSHSTFLPSGVRKPTLVRFIWRRSSEMQ